MKKLLAGCFIVAVIAGGALGVALYFGYRTMRPMVDSVTGWVDQARNLAAESDRLEHKGTYTPPASGELSEAQVRRFLAVHQHVRKRLGPRWADLQAKARAFEDRARQGERNLSLSEIGAVLSELGTVVVDARRAHIDALNTERFSSSEYRWVRLRAYEAAGMEVASGIDWSRLEEWIEKGAEQVGVPVPTVPAPEIPTRNRELVKPHVEALKDWLPLIILGF